MPLYEEKLISPLAIRFTQQRIRTKFRDNRKLEDSIREIEVQSGVGDYDIVLKAPFPNIEIIRWSANGRKAKGQSHWFSFDNRRLYCLQRVAAEYWPKRVGAVVEVMYADAGTIRKKLDSQTCGLSVSIGHAFATPNELEEWAWRKDVQKRAPPGNFALTAEALIQADDAKENVNELVDVPQSPSNLESMNTEFDSRDSTGDKLEEAQAKEPSCERLLEPESATAVSQAVCRPAAPAVEDSPLTDLIAQLLDLKVQESSEAHEPAVDDALSTHLSESTDCTDLETSAAESARLDTSSVKSCESEFLSMSEGEDFVEKTPPVSRKPLSSQLKATVQHSTKSLTKASSEKKKAKAGTTRNCAKEPCAPETLLQQHQKMEQWAAQAQLAQCQAAQFHMAQLQRAQMGQWQSAQMAQWQQAALFAHRAAQHQAAQKRQWQI